MPTIAIIFCCVQCALYPCLRFRNDIDLDHELKSFNQLYIYDIMLTALILIVENTLTCARKTFLSIVYVLVLNMIANLSNEDEPRSQ